MAYTQARVPLFRGRLRRPGIVSKTSKSLLFLQQGREPTIGAVLAEMLFALDRIPVFAQVDNLSASGASGRLEGRRIGQFLKVVFVRAVVDIDFGSKRGSTPLAPLPVPRVTFVEVVRAERETAVIPVTTVAGE